MVDDITYLTVEEVKQIHVRVMLSMGWNEAPLRAEGELSSAVSRPQHAAYYDGADIAYQAVTLCAGISQNQPFVDGNKRTAMAAMRVFLQLNGYAIRAEPLSIALHIEAIADRHGTLDEAIDEFAAWLRERIKPLDKEQ
jgi:death on curing protein